MAVTGALASAGATASTTCRPVRRWIRRSITAAAVVGVALAAGMSSAHAEPYENVRFHDQSSEIVDDFCGDLHVRIDFQDQGHFVLRPTGPDSLARATETHHGGSTFTNLATGKSFSITWNYANQDVRVTDNGDGTLTILSQVPGPERFYGPDGQLLFTNGGTLRLETVLDDAGTPSDPSDDTFISEELVSAHGGKPQAPFDFCDSFRTLTS